MIFSLYVTSISGYLLKFYMKISYIIIILMTKIGQCTYVLHLITIVYLLSINNNSYKLPTKLVNRYQCIVIC